MNLSEERIFELHRELAGKLIEEARAIRAQEIQRQIALGWEIVGIRREIVQEINKISGYGERARGPKDVEEDD
jgi:2-keto-4-pentenoate hydratase